MHAPAPAPPPHRPPATGVVVLLRVVFVAVTVGSLGLLAWAAMLRAAIVQRRPLGWWLFGADLAVLAGVCFLVLSYAETDWRTNLAVGALLLQMTGAVAYYLVVDIREAARPAYGQGYAPAPAPAPHPYVPPQPPAPPSPYAQQPRPYAPGTRPYPNPSPNSHPHPNPNLNPNSTPYAQDRPQPQRIDQVRAELDELSDYLRQEEQR
ncbi:hypothetical protein [Streptomyces sp. NPDC053427]|uniref:hypothetical protein n=1 Tax=Streptomyces sp. NPDC053427 TaxID=3365701 RepID=UPI0037D3E748